MYGFLTIPARGTHPTHHILLDSVTLILLAAVLSGSAV